MATSRSDGVDSRLVKLQVGCIAMFLPVLTSFAALPDKLTSISASYWEGHSTQTLFVGGLFAIAFLMFAYDGFTAGESAASRLGALFALLVALYPCGCEPPPHEELVQGVHGIAAAGLYVVLAFFCLRFMSRAKRKEGAQARRRSHVYVLCFVALTVAMLMLAGQHWLMGECREHLPFIQCDRWVWFWETVGLEAFGIAWFTASHWLWWLNSPEERFDFFGSGRFAR